MYQARAAGVLCTCTVGTQGLWEGMRQHRTHGYPVSLGLSAAWVSPIAVCAAFTGRAKTKISLSRFTR